MEKKMRIGYHIDNYATKRLVIGKIEKAQYTRVFDLSRIVHFLFRILKKLGLNFHKQVFNWQYIIFGIMNMGRVNCIHFFNNVYLCSTLNWISSFETMLPRQRGTPSLKEIKAIAAKNCKAILPLSKCSYYMELNLLEYFPEYKDKILKKMFVLHPPQELLINNMAEKRKNDKLTFVFVGNDFFRKMGMEALNAFDRLKCKSKLKLIIISNMQIDCYVPYYNEQHKEQTLAFFAKNSNWIDFYKGLPNNDVLQIIKDSDIGLLSTKADTYGYSVLEMQAAGVPVITTDVRALPEINNNECGWLIPVTKNKFGEALYSNEQELVNLGIEIENGLYSILCNILDEYQANGMDFILKKGKLCLERITKEHSPKNYGKFLENIINANDFLEYGK